MKFGTHDESIVVNGFGVVTSGVIGSQALWSKIQQGDRAETLEIAEFKAASRYVDPKYLRATSRCDAVALTALATLLESTRPSAATYDEHRIGLYVGAAPASAHGNEPYIEAMLQTRGREGRASIREFGSTYRGARPTTLLLGLPNNTLCYGSMMLRAKGPNSNYTVPWLGGVLAVANASVRLRRRQLDWAVAGSYSAYANPLSRSLFRQLAERYGSAEFSENFADGSAFVALERRAKTLVSDTERWTEVLSCETASDGLGPMRYDPQGRVFERLIKGVLAEAEIEAKDIGLILLTQGGFGCLDQIERDVIERVFASELETMALASWHRVLGQLMEVQAVLGLGLIGKLLDLDRLPPAVALDGYASRLDPAKRAALIVQVSPWGQYGALVVRQAGLR